MREGEGTSGPESESGDDRQHSRLDGWVQQGAVLRALFDDAPRGIIITRADGRILECNTRISEMLGYPSEELLSRRFNDITHPDDVSLGMEAWRDLVSGAREDAVLVKRYIRKDGTAFWARLHVSPIRDPRGPVQLFVTSVDDITEDQRREAALRDSEQRLRALLEALPCLYFNLSADGTFLDYKPVKGLGLYVPPDVFLGKRVDSVLPPDMAEQVLVALEQAIATRSVVTIGYQLPGDEGLRDYEAQISAYGPEGAAVLIVDVSERRRAEEDRARMQVQIIAAQRETLRQLSTPLISIADGVIAMPLIGPVDTDRAHQMLEALLGGVSRSQARTLIIDITGVPNVDDDVAALFVRAAQAARMLGAEVLLAGVRPEVARSLVELSVDLGDLRTVGSFQAAIAFALRGSTSPAGRPRRAERPGRDP